jgi:hypothetical protein
MEEAQNGENIVGKIKQDLEREGNNFSILKGKIKLYL